MHVVEQRRERAVERRAQRLPHQAEVVAVRVPRLVDAPAGHHGDEPHAGLDQPAGEQERLAEVRQPAELAGLDAAVAAGVGAVALAELRRVPATGRRRARVSGDAMISSAFCWKTFMRSMAAASARRADRAVERLAQVVAGAEAVERHLGEEVEAGDRVVGEARVAADERVELRAEEAGLLPADVDAVVPLELGEVHVRRDRLLGPGRSFATTGPNGGKVLGESVWISFEPSTGERPVSM